MNINKHNYEAFFLDYYEGSLSAEKVAELMLFLGQHPELKEEFESFENITLEETGHFVFEGKEQLKKNAADTITSSNCEEFFINSAEHNLNTEEEKALEVFLQRNPALRKDRELYLKTILPAEKFVFEGKERLKKGRKVISLYYYVSAAAAVLLAVGLYFLLIQEKPAAAPQLAKNTEEKKVLPVNENGASVAVHENKEVKKEKRAWVSSSRNETTLVKTSIADTNDIQSISRQNIATLGNRENSKQLITNNVMVPEMAADTTPAMALETTGSGDKYLSVREFAGNKIREKLGFWEIARAAAKGVGKITGKESDVVPTYNQQGEVTGYTVTAGRFQFERSTDH